MLPPLEMLTSWSPVQEGRECPCGETRRDQMVADLDRPDGHKPLCLECLRRKQRTYREDPAVRAREAARTTSGVLREAAAPHWAAFGERHRCIYCHAALEDVDHVVPRSAGGSDDPSNLVPSCVECNRGVGGKFAKPLLVWAAERAAAGRPLKPSALLSRVFEQISP